MTQFWRAHHALDGLARWPVVRDVLQQKYERRFAGNQRSNLFRGVFPSFEAAERSAPPTRPVGYDNEASAALYMERTQRVYPTDYPVMLWLGKLFAQGCDGVFDVGGHVGVSYYAYRRYLAYPANLNWVVHDVPAVTTQGRKLAAEMDGDGRLGFSDAFDDVDGMPVLLAAGSLQYLPETLAERLSRLAAPPTHLLVNLLPLHDRESFFTLQSVGTAFCPYRVMARPEFVRSLESMGYERVDEWENPDKQCVIPFHETHSLDRYHGFYFRRSS